MNSLIEPNIHPILVHFAYALSITAVAAYLLSRFPPAARWRDTLAPAADWMLAFGALAIIATIIAGLQAYYTVDHDAPSHAAMTTHRNWAVPSGSAIILLAIWRWTNRAKAASAVFIAGLTAAALALTVTAWWGGTIVYSYGLGVKSLPTVTGDGHDHDHGGGTPTMPEDHDMSTMDAIGPEEDDHGAAGGMAGTTGHDNSDGHHAPVAAAHDAGDGHHDTESSVPADIAPETPGTPGGVVDAFHSALKTGDSKTISGLTDPAVIIAEGGSVERSLEVYAGHHMPADMAYTAAVSFDLKDRQVLQSGDMATVISQSDATGTYEGKAIHMQTMETMVLQREGGAWKITHIHWSSSPVTDDHSH